MRLRVFILIWFTVLSGLTGQSPTPAGAAISVAPTLSAPDDGATLTSFGPALAWANPGGATQYHLQVIPKNNDGPGIDVHIGSIGTQFIVPPPPFWYGLLPDVTYTWRVRVSDSASFAGLDDLSWGAWAERKFRTPKASADTIKPLMPALAETISPLTPMLQWENSRSDVFYYELQLSKDANFNTDPATATASVYWLLLHGGVSQPWNTYRIPSSSPLEDRTTYYWRLRPRVQGDGSPIAWSTTYSFKTDSTVKLGLTVQDASFGLRPADRTACTIAGDSAIMTSTPLLTGLYYAYSYSGGGSVVHDWYRGDEQLSSFGTVLTNVDTCLASGVGRPGGGPDDGAPLQPGMYRLDVWSGGQKIHSNPFIITEASDLAFGPIITGTGLASFLSCRLTGVATSFPRTATTVWFRWNYVGSGTYALSVSRGQTSLGSVTVDLPGPAACAGDYVTKSTGLDPGTYTVRLLIGGSVKQTATFTVQ